MRNLHLKLIMLKNKENMKRNSKCQTNSDRFQILKGYPILCEEQPNDIIFQFQRLDFLDLR